MPWFSYRVGKSPSQFVKAADAESAIRFAVRAHKRELRRHRRFVFEGKLTDEAVKKLKLEGSPSLEAFKAAEGHFILGTGISGEQ